MNTISVIAVVVTYNRPELLEQCLAAIATQTYPLEKVIVIDNASHFSLDHIIQKAQSQLAVPLSYMRMDKNLGGAGGFKQGLIEASKTSPEWIWVMDDDCIPNKDTLAELIRPITHIQEPIGFICSHILWKDGSPHKMNIPLIQTTINQQPFNMHVDQHVVRIKSCSFVSTLISTQAIKECGLPLADLFIWGDDVEYFLRIHLKGFYGYYAFNSKALHSTALNNNDNIESLPDKDLWKIYYGVRNNLFLIKKNQKYSRFLSTLIKKLTVGNIHLLQSNQQKKWEVIKYNSKGALASVFFNPQK